jgi:hypothetical protein
VKAVELAHGFSSFGLNSKELCNCSNYPFHRSLSDVDLCKKLRSTLERDHARKTAAAPSEQRRCTERLSGAVVELYESDSAALGRMAWEE